MLRPVEAQLTLYNVEHKAGQVKDPNAALYQAVQKDEIIKNADQQAHTVQPSPKSEGEVKIREDKNRKREQEQQGKKRKKRDDNGGEAEERTEQDGSGFDFYA